MLGIPFPLLPWPLLLHLRKSYLFFLSTQEFSMIPPVSILHCAAWPDSCTYSLHDPSSFGRSAKLGTQLLWYAPVRQFYIPNEVIDHTVHIDPIVAELMACSILGIFWAPIAYASLA